jgi:ABC-type transport system involved in multi-copper enzyme maturation, permease component
VSLAGFITVTGVECAKLAAQLKSRIVLAACVAGPFAFAAAMRVQSSLPEDTLFGRWVKESGFAIPLVVLGFAALWVFPVVTSVVGGDLFAAEDRHGTWKTLLTRSRSRSEIFLGKVVTAFGFSILAILVLAASSIAAGLLIIGDQPLVDLSGVLLPSSQALGRVGLAWASVLPPACGLTALAVLLSVATRSSAAGIGLPVVIALVMQLYALVDGPEIVRRLLITSAFGAWHGLLAEPAYYGPLVYGSATSVGVAVTCLLLAHRILQRRDIGG